jgi:hypothetical protein
VVLRASHMVRVSESRMGLGRGGLRGDGYQLRAEIYTQPVPPLRGEMGDSCLKGLEDDG